MKGLHVLQAAPVQPLAQAGKASELRRVVSGLTASTPAVGSSQKVLVPVAHQGHQSDTYFWVVWASIPAGPISLLWEDELQPILTSAVHGTGPRQSSSDRALGCRVQPSLETRHSKEHTQLWVQEQCRWEQLPAGRQQVIQRLSDSFQNLMHLEETFNARKKFLFPPS